MLRSFQNIANPTNTLPLTPKYDKNISAKKVDYTKKPDDSLKTKAPGYNFINFWIQNADVRLSEGSLVFRTRRKLSPFHCVELSRLGTRSVPLSSIFYSMH
jgi:hypothetical protein